MKIEHFQIKTVTETFPRWITKKYSTQNKTTCKHQMDSAKNNKPS